MFQPLVSFIVPIYNGATYIRSAVNELLEQEYKNIEIILVNDGSRDNSLKLCKEQATLHPEVRVINKQNSGIGSSRNAGLRAANGDYIAFMDQDDCIKTNMLASVMPIILEEKLDVIFFKYSKVFPKKEIEGYKMFPQRGTPSDDRLIIDYFSDHFFGFVWCSVYKKSFLKNNDIFFNEEYHVIDDIDFMYSVLSHHPKVFFYPQTFYRWTQRSDSESHQNFIQPAQDIMPFLDRILENERERGPYIRNVIYGYCLEQYLQYYKGLLKQHVRDELFEEIKARAKKVAHKVKVRDLEIPVEKKIKILLFRIGLLDVIFKIKR